MTPTNLKSFQSEISASSSSSSHINNNNSSSSNTNIKVNHNNNKNINNNNNNNNNNNIVNYNKTTSAASTTATGAASRSKSTKMSAAAVDLRSMSHSPSPMIESNNNIVDRKTGLPYHHKNVIGMKGTAGTTGNAQVNGTSSSHVHVYKESSISLKPTNGLQDQVPQQSNPPPQMYSLQPRQILTDPRGPTVSLAFKTPKLHYSNQLYIYPYYVVTFCETAQSKLETDVTPQLEKQIKYCNVFYFDLNAQHKQPPPPPEEGEEEEEEWTEFYEEVHHTTVITETKTEAANAFQMQQHAAAQQTSADDKVMYTDNQGLNGPEINGGGSGSLTNGGTHAPPGGGADAAAANYKGPSLSDVISLEESPNSGPKSKSKRHSK